MSRKKLYRIGLFIFMSLIFQPFGQGREIPSATPTTQDETTKYVLVVTGDELVKGIYADTHTQFITRTLGPLGCECFASISVGDQPRHLLDVLKYAATHASLIIVTGGLGPTDADVTRQTLTQFTHIGLHEDPDVLVDMKRRFGGPTGELRSNTRRQSLVPEKGTYLRNPNGTAVGLVFDDGKRVVVALPGPPRELQPMVKNELIPFLAKRFGTHSIGSKLMMRFVGIGESMIDQTLHDTLTYPPDLTVEFKFESGRVDLTLCLPGNTPEDRTRLKEMEKTLLKSLGDYMYTDEEYSLEECVIRLLANRKATLETAEVGSGGAIAASLNNVENAPLYFGGGHVAPSDKVLARMLDYPDQSFATLETSGEELARALAQRACEREETDWAVAITGAQKWEGDNRFVWVALGSLKGGFITQRLNLRGSGDLMRSNLVNQTLDLLRKQLMKE